MISASKQMHGVIAPTKMHDSRGNLIAKNSNPSTRDVLSRLDGFGFEARSIKQATD
jgi:hypothetical protein